MRWTMHVMSMTRLRKYIAWTFLLSQDSTRGQKHYKCSQSGFNEENRRHSRFPDDRHLLSYWEGWKSKGQGRYHPWCQLAALKHMFLKGIPETTVDLNTFLETPISCHRPRKWFLTNGLFVAMTVVRGQISINGCAQEGNSNWDGASFSPAKTCRCFCLFLESPLEMYSLLRTFKIVLRDESCVIIMVRIRPYSGFQIH